MGIPSYFSYIIKNHSNIIRNKRRLKVKFSSLYMDCNSIIYDCVRKIEHDTDPRPNGFDFEDLLIRHVITKIEKYVNDIQPSNVLYIAFDGVAPFAKMEQQRIRRYKTGYLSAVSNGTVSHKQNEKSNNETGSIVSPENQTSWNTSAITPGTQFMNMLSLKVRRAFIDSGRFFGVKHLVVSGSDEPGEGEHKMFQYMRSNALKTETIAVYGLDADLIMLSLFHCFACENIYIFRESPEFGRAALEDSFDRDELLYLDNCLLSRAILDERGVSETETDTRGRIYDYIFACFLLGNDFMPHFPALNIRTHGNYTILETYRKLIARYPDRRFISLESGNIQWKWVKLFLQNLAKEEHRLVLNEHESRHKMEKRFYPTNTREERLNAFEHIPTIYRAEEHYINPGESGWETRYYDVAFHLKDSNSNQIIVDEICNNYLEGLEWTFKYYTEGCPHWKWKYNYHYPPLLVDLVKRIPNFETTYIVETSGINRPFHPNTQLAYVIPPWNHNLLRDSHASTLEEEYYVRINDLQFQWMFCKFFWESHAILPEIPLDKLEKLDEMNSTQTRKK
jgi:5'-3' exonuclease